MTDVCVNRRRFLEMASIGLLPGQEAVPDNRRQIRADDTESRNSGLDIGAVYIPFLGDKWGKCIDHQPAVGQYDITNTDVINKQIAQMQGCGISTVLFNFGASELDFERFRSFRRAERSDEVAIEAFWVINRIFQRNYEFAPYLEFIRDEMVSLPNYETIDGRPVVTFWAPGYIAVKEAARKRIREEWGGLDELFSKIRTELTVDGNEPFLVGDIGGWGIDGFPKPIRRLGRQFDAITSWTGSPDPGLNPWDEHRRKVEESFRRSFWFAVSNDLEFVPMVFPGFDDRPNDCWGDGRHVPRSTGHLAELFELAFQYRTIDRTYVATWNGWPEGHQIEPGTFSGHDYGTAYLDVVNEAATSQLPPFRIESFVPVTLAFNRTVEESEVNPDKSGENSRDLAFRCSELELLTDHGETVATYNVGTPDSEPQFTEGAYHAVQNDRRSTRWLGGPTARTRMYFERDLVLKSAILRVRGLPITDDIAADVLVDGTRTDRLKFARDGWQDYVADLRATTPTDTTTATANRTTVSRSDTAGRSSTAADSPGTTHPKRAMTTGESTRAESTTSVDSPGFGFLAGLAALTLGAGRYLSERTDR